MTLACDIEDFGAFDANMTSMEEEKTKQAIELHICSDGGDIYRALAHVARILQSPITVNTVGYGCVASSSVLLLIVGKKRKLSRLAWIMLHEVSLENEKDSSDNLTVAKQEVENTDKLMEQYYQLLGEYTSKKPAYWRGKIKGKGNVYINAEKALELGMVDELF